MKGLLKLLVLLPMVSCVSLPVMHYSLDQNVPVLTQKGETRLTVATGTETVGFQGAWAFSKSLAVMGSYSQGLNEMRNPGLIGDGSFDVGGRQSGQCALGYYKDIGHSMIFETYIGAERYYRSYSETGLYPYHIYTTVTSTNCTVPFVQFDLGLKQVKKHRFSLSLKVGVITWDHFSLLATDTLTGKLAPTANNYNLKPDLEVEPCITYRLGNKALSFQAQAGLLFTDPTIYSLGNLGFENPLYFNIGLGIHLFSNWKAVNNTPNQTHGF